MVTDQEDAKMRSASAIMVSALVVGIAIFLGVCWFLWQQDPPREAAESTPLLSNIAAGMLVLSLFVRLLARKVMLGKEKGAAMFALGGGAILEFGGLFGCVAYLLEGTPLALGVAVAAMLLIVVLQFPTAARWEAWSRSARTRDLDVPDSFESGL